MATYAIGDIQGCYDSLQALLDRIGFDPARDRLWLLGDLVNRGPGSLEVLRWAREMDDRVVAVLGNHDIYLLLRAAGASKKRKLDTLDRVLAAPDREQLIDWLRHRPLLHREGGFLMVHAGLHPTWSGHQAELLAHEVEALLRAADWRDRIAQVQAQRTQPWHTELFGLPRLQAILSVLTRIRVCDGHGRMHDKFSGPPSEAPRGYMPWFDVPEAPWHGGERILFGHWAALGLHVGTRAVGLDTGCVWGGQLSAFRLDDAHLEQVPAVEDLRLRT